MCLVEATRPPVTVAVGCSALKCNELRLTVTEPVTMRPEVGKVHIMFL